MKYAIMSDAHGNPAALKKAYADACEQGCEKFLFLGDAVGDGYDDKTTVDFVRENLDVVLSGNHEFWKMDLNSPKGICVSYLTLLPIRISMLRNPSRCRWRMVAALSSIVEASDIRGLTYVLHTRNTILTPRG